MQIPLFNHIKLYEGLYPELEFVYHPPNGMWTSPTQAAKFKSMGTRPGLLDVMCHTPSREFQGLAIELKWGAGQVTHEQLKWMCYYEEIGYFVLTVKDNWVTAWEVLKFYFDIKLEEKLV